MKNLIVNAIRHSSERGEVWIILEDSRLTVSNVAADGAPLDKSALFLRFSHGNVHQKGNGLVLAIVKAVCDLHHWTVEYSFQLGCHRFIVNFQPQQS